MNEEIWDKFDHVFGKIMNALSIIGLFCFVVALSIWMTS